MEPIYHLVPRKAWEASGEGDYRCQSLITEGFIHCSFAHQVAWAANRFHATADDLLVLRLDPARLTSPLRVEPPIGKSADANLFPHVYGPINRSAIVAVLPLARSEGAWQFQAVDPGR